LRPNFLTGHEQIFRPDYSMIEKIYIGFFGMPVIGLRIRNRNVLSLIPKKKYHHILDAGSGQGVLSFALSSHFPDATILGIDQNKQTIESCQHIAQKTSTTNIFFRQDQIETLPERNLFDLITCIDILEHIHDDHRALTQLYQAMSFDGLLILHVPAKYRRYPVWKKNLNFHVDSHVRVGYDLRHICQKARGAGFYILDAGYTYGFWETLSNNISYMITRAQMKNKWLYALFFPVLHMISLLGMNSRPKKLGAGIYLLLTKKNS